MSKESPHQEGAFDLERLRELFQMMEEHGVTEVNLKSNEETWRIQRGAKTITAPDFAAMMPPPMAAVPPPPQAVAGAPAAADAPTDDGTITIDSPTVGTFYSSPNPEDPPFVKVGSDVEPETIVCIVEAMKVFNQIPAEVRGKIVRVLVSNGDPVEFGQPLFTVDPG